MNDTSKLFFNERTIFELNWRNDLKFRLGAVLPSSREQISNSLKDMSSVSIRNRFMGSKKEFSSKELEYLTNLDGWDHYAIGIEERAAPHRGVAVARLVRSQTEKLEAEIAITVIDEYQGLGLGSLLIRLITLAASERELETLTFTTLPQNSELKHLILKIGVPTVVSIASDYEALNLDLRSVDLGAIKSQLLPFLPEIGTFGSGT